REEPAPMGGKLPSEVEKIVARCLRKDPARRFQHIDDVKVELEELKADLESGKTGVAATPGPKRGRRWLWAAPIAAALLLAVALGMRLRRGEPPPDLHAVALTSNSSGSALDPSFSPDGRKVAFAWNGEKADNMDIYVKQIGAVGPPMPLTTNPAPDINPAWSPNGEWIAFRRRLGGADAIMLIPSVGGQERELDRIPPWKPPFRIAPMSSGSWTPDSKWLVFAAQDSPGGPTSIRAISVETRERRQQTTFRTQSMGAEVVLGDSSPSLSPDGRTLAFARHVKTWVFELYALRLTRDLRPDGEPARVIDRRHSAITGIEWTADGGEIVYAAGVIGNAPLWRVPASGNRAPKRLPYAPRAIGAPAIARAVSRLAFASSTYTSSIWRLNTRTGERIKLSSAKDAFIQHLQYSPDGRKISYNSNRSGDGEIWTCDADGSHCLQLTSFESAFSTERTTLPVVGLSCGAPRWSPDSRWLTFSCNPEGHIEIYVMPADGGAPRRVTHFDATNNISSFSQDGLWIYFASDRSGRYEVWKTPAKGGEAVQVTRSGGYGAFESTDGNLYYTKYPAPSPLFRMPVGGGAEAQVLPKVVHFSAFAVTKEGIYSSPDGRTIQFLDTASNKTVNLAWDEPFEFFLCVSPDGAYVLTSQIDRNATNLMLVEGFR
ncbi:MAG: hypothetical protein NTW28_10910, partial [Candidatus Solibacter sp.]|nr:hypothetical protein [Candidatus Solibacter sp.]